MAESQNNFSDGAGYERFMGRWSRLAGQQFIKWVDAPKGVAKKLADFTQWANCL